MAKELSDLSATKSKLEAAKGVPPLQQGPHHQRIVPLDGQGKDEDKDPGITKSAVRALGAERKKGWLRGN